MDILWDNPEKAEMVPPLMIWGPPGIGKSTFIRNLCKENEIGFIDVRLAQREPVDIRGLPVPEMTDKESIGSFHPNGLVLETRILLRGASFYSMKSQLLTAHFRSLLTNSFLIEDLANCTKFQMDGTSLLQVTELVMLLLLEPCLAHWQTDSAHLEVASNSSSWLDWALVNNLDPRVTGFIRYMPQNSFSMEGNKERGWPSPRSWERAAMELELATQKRLDDDLLHVIVEGLIGEGAALEFMAFLQWSGKIPDVGKMLAGEIKPTIPKRPDQSVCYAVRYCSQHAST